MWHENWGARRELTVSARKSEGSLASRSAYAFESTRGGHEILGAEVRDDVGIPGYGPRTPEPSKGNMGKREGRAERSHPRVRAGGGKGLKRVRRRKGEAVSQRLLWPAQKVESAHAGRHKQDSPACCTCKPQITSHMTHFIARITSHRIPSSGGRLQGISTQGHGRDIYSTRIQQATMQLARRYSVTARPVAIPDGLLAPLASRPTARK